MEEAKRGGPGWVYTFHNDRAATIVTVSRLRPGGTPRTRPESEANDIAVAEARRTYQQTYDEEMPDTTRVVFAEVDRLPSDEEARELMSMVAKLVNKYREINGAETPPADLCAMILAFWRQKDR